MQFSSVALPLQSWTGGIESSMSKKRNASKRHTRIQPHTHVQHSSTMQYSTTFKWKCKYKQKYQCKYQYQYQHPYNAISARYRAARYFAAQQGFKHYSTAQHSAVQCKAMRYNANAMQYTAVQSCKCNSIQYHPLLTRLYTEYTVSHYAAEGPPSPPPSTWSLELITRNPESVLNSKSRESLEVPRTLGSPMVQGFAVQTCINMDREEFRLGTTKGQAKPLTINMGFQTEQNLHGKPQTPDSVSSAHQVSRGSGLLELSAGALPRYSANPALLRGVSSQSITVALPSISQPC